MRQLTLRASSAAEAAAWVGAVLKERLRRQSETEPPLGTARIADLLEGSPLGLVAPTVSLAPRGPAHEAPPHGHPAGGAAGLSDVLSEIARRLGEAPAVFEKVVAKVVLEIESPIPDVIAVCGVGGRTAELMRWSHPRVLVPAPEAASELFGDRVSASLDGGSWTMQVSIEEGVSVLHRVWASAALRKAGASGPTSFCFQLELSLSLGASLGAVRQARVQICDYCAEGVDAAAKEELVRVLRPLLPPHLEYHVLWRRPLGEQCVHRDLPRLMRGLAVRCHARGETLYEDDGRWRESPASQLACLGQLLGSLSRRLDPPAVSAAICDGWDGWLREAVPVAEGELPDKLQALFSQPWLPPTSAALAVLRCISQSMVAPAVKALHRSVYSLARYRDLRGEWRVSVDIERDGRVTVRHDKWEQAADASPLAFFKFRWCLALTFDARVASMLAATVSVVDFAFGPRTEPEQERRVRALLRPWLAPGVPYQHVWASLDPALKPRRM